MITIEQIENFANTVKEEYKDCVNDSHTASEYSGLSDGLDSLIGYLKQHIDAQNNVELKVTGVRYFETFRGVGYEATTNVENVKIWNDGYGGASWIPQNKPYTTPYLKLTEMELESLIDDYEKSNYSDGIDRLIKELKTIKQ